MNPIQSIRRATTLVSAFLLLTLAFFAFVSGASEEPADAWYVSCDTSTYQWYNPEATTAHVNGVDIPSHESRPVPDNGGDNIVRWDNSGDTYTLTPSDCMPPTPTEPTTPPAAPNATVTYQCVEVEGKAAGLIELSIANVEDDTMFTFDIPDVGISIDGVGPSFTQYVLPFEAGTYSYTLTVGDTVIHGTFGASDCTPSEVVATFDTECVDGNANGVAKIDVSGPDPEEEFLFYVGPEATPISWADQTASIGFTAGEPGDEVILRLTLAGETVAMATVKVPECGPVPTEPTTPSTTSTTPPPTSSTTSTTSTTAPSTTSSSTTSSTQPATTSSTAAPPTSVEQQTPTTPSTTVPTGTLPRTGGSSDTAATIALIVLAGGIALLIVASRRFQQQHLS
jgi:LPXTG-motif cell wall-anchored protein